MAKRRNSPDPESKRSADDHSRANIVIDEAAAEVGHATPFTVRETRRLYRLRAEQFVAVVAADTEEEARALAASYDLLGADWRNADFASAEVEDTAESHVFGDVVISSVPTAPEPSKRK
jgi:alkanesulfonate monooxygenase SsuD/methylene tetrahydromethanopterin reductase-like flavin-dependent oxidoreductase (luciferase family)